MARGFVYLVATPVGNLEDITLRAIRTLREADLIACEDTRRTGRLLRHFGIDKPLVSCHEHNERARAAEIADRAARGESVAIVSDAGTPCISDPGFRVVKAALDKGVAVVPIPGPSAAIAALSAAGLPTHRFLFAGFLPARKSKRREALLSIKKTDATIVLYEAPHRILTTLADIRELLGDRPVTVAREMTKLHEEFLRGTAGSVIEELRKRNAIRGEFVVLVAPGGDDPQAAPGTLQTRVEELERAGHRRMDAIKRAARERGMTKRAAYAQLEGARARKPGASASPKESPQDPPRAAPSGN